MSFATGVQISCAALEECTLRGKKNEKKKMHDCLIFEIKWSFKVMLGRIWNGPQSDFDRNSVRELTIIANTSHLFS